MRDFTHRPGGTREGGESAERRADYNTIHILHILHTLSHTIVPVRPRGPYRKLGESGTRETAKRKEKKKRASPLARLVSELIHPVGS